MHIYIDSDSLNLLKKGTTLTTTQRRLQSILDSTRSYKVPYNPAAEEVNNRLVNLFLRQLVPDALGTVSCRALAVFDRVVNNPCAYDPAISVNLLELKEVIQKDHDEALTLLLDQKKTVAKSSSVLYAALSSKEVNAKRITAAQEADDLERQKMADLLHVFIDARCAEEYYRMVVPVYESKTTEDALWGILMVLRTDVYNRKADNKRHEFVESVMKALYNA